MSIELQQNHNQLANSDRAKSLLNQHVEDPEVITLGSIIERTDIKSNIGPFSVLPEYKTQYPEVVTKALASLYAEYNEAFGPLVSQNTEFDTDYQFSIAPDGTPINRWVQIDMVGLPEGFLEAASDFSEEDIKEVLRTKIFEIENSLAMYQLLENLFSEPQKDSLFKNKFLASLDDLRQKHGKPIALLAVTDLKHNAMRESEFGKFGEESLTDNEVAELSGFDKFFSPEEFKQHLAENDGECQYLLYVRSSDPVAKLKKPETVLEDTLLKDPDMRRVIKANSITFNIDAPEMEDARKINDTKEYLEPMSMAFSLHSDTDLFSTEFAAHLASGGAYSDFPEGTRLSANLIEHLKSQGITPLDVERGDVLLRSKPMKGTYGCYGHLSGALNDRDFRKELRLNMRKRGAYVIQPEMRTPLMVNEVDAQAYTYIDRVFMSTDGENYSLMGGFRSLMPLSSVEAQNGRIHGNGSTVWAEIL